MTATYTGTIEEVVTAHEFTLPCELPVALGPFYIGGCGGANPAEWILHLNQCCNELDSHVLYCTRCKDLVLSQRYCWCPFCKFVFAPPSTAFRLIEPLGRPA